MASPDDTQEARLGGLGVRAMLLPVAVMVVVVGIVAALVFSGAVQGHEPRTGPTNPTTTQPTEMIAP